MTYQCSETETHTPAGWPARLVTAIRREIDCALMITELRGLSDELLADIGTTRADIASFARASVHGEAAGRAGGGPVTSIGSDVWNRAVLLHMR